MSERAPRAQSSIRVHQSFFWMSERAGQNKDEICQWASEQVKIRMIFANERASAKSAPSAKSATSSVGQITALNTKIWRSLEKEMMNFDQYLFKERYLYLIYFILKIIITKWYITFPGETFIQSSDNLKYQKYQYIWYRRSNCQRHTIWNQTIKVWISSEKRGYLTKLHKFCKRNIQLKKCRKVE